MTSQNIAIIGLGTLGTQLAIQAAAYGHRVRGFDPDPSAFARMQTKVREAMRMTRKGPTFPVDEWEQHAAKGTAGGLSPEVRTDRDVNASVNPGLQSTRISIRAGKMNVCSGAVHFGGPAAALGRAEPLAFAIMMPVSRH